MMSRFFPSTARWLLLAFFIASTTVTALAQTGRDAQFARANTLFEKGDFAGAEQQFRNLVTAGNASEDLFFNLGNAIYHQERPGEAALWYHRALVLDPRMTEARQNLKVLEHRIGYLEFEPKGIGLVLEQLTEGEIISLLSAGIWIAIFGVVLLVALRRRRSWRPLLWIVLALAIANIVFAAWCLKRYRTDFALSGRAIVIAPEAQANTGPVPDAEKVIALPPGSEVRIVLDRGAWTFVDIPGEIRGWVRTEMIEPIAME